MRKGLFIILIIALLTVMIPSAAQSEEIPSCTDKELIPTLEAVVALTTMYTTISRVTTSEGYVEGDAVIHFGAESSNFWYEQYPTLSTCLESRAIAHQYGLALDEVVIENAVAELAAFEAEYGDADVAQAYLDYNASRVERNEGLIASTFGVMTETGTVAEDTFTRLPSCTPEDDASEAVSDMMALIQAYQDVRASTDSTTPEGLTTLISGYAGISNIHWLEIYPALPACYEINKFANNVGLIYEQTLISVLLSRLSLYETEFRYPDNGSWLNSAAAIRQEILTMLFAEAFPPAEE